MSELSPRTSPTALFRITEQIKARLSAVEARPVFDLTAVTVASLRSWTLAAAYTIVSSVRDSDGVLVSAVMSWPDGSAGTFTRTTKNATFLTIDAYTMTHAISGKTITQSAVTRDSSGNVTAQPALTITP